MMDWTSAYAGEFIALPFLVIPTKKQRADPSGSALCQNESLTDRLNFSDEHARQPTQPHRGLREKPRRARGLQQVEQIER